MKSSNLALILGWCLWALQIGLLFTGVAEYIAAAFVAAQVYFAASLVLSELEKKNHNCK